MYRMLTVITLVLNINLAYSNDVVIKRVMESFQWLKYTDTRPYIFFDNNLADIETINSNIYTEQKIGRMKYAKNSDYLEVSLRKAPNGRMLAMVTYFFNGIRKEMCLKTSALIIPGTGYLYSVSDRLIYFGNTDNHVFYDKYEYKDGEFQLITQPLYYVNFKSTAMQEITLYSDLDEKDNVGTIQKHTDVLVIGVKFERSTFLLLQTKFGLVGWHKFEPTDVHFTSIQGVFLSPDG